jgi:probable phosphoglycerate mutase
LGIAHLTRFLLIRHAHHDAIGRYLAGQASGLHLNDEGREQVRALVAALHDVPLAAVVSSPLERTRETAEPIARDHGLELILLDDVIEYGVGKWTGIAFTALDGHDEWRRFNDLRSLTRPPGGELMLDVQARAVAALLRLHEQFPSTTVAVVFHGDVIRAVLLYVLGMPVDFLHRIEISPGRISIMDLGPDSVRVLQVNGDTCSAGL